MFPYSLVYKPPVSQGSEDVEIFVYLAASWGSKNQPSLDNSPSQHHKPPYMVVSLNRRPQYRPLNMLIFIMEIPKRVPSILTNPHDCPMIRHFLQGPQDGPLQICGPKFCLGCQKVVFWGSLFRAVLQKNALPTATA